MAEKMWPYFLDHVSTGVNALTILNNDWFHVIACTMFYRTWQQAPITAYVIMGLLTLKLSRIIFHVPNELVNFILVLERLPFPILSTIWSIGLGAIVFELPSLLGPKMKKKARIWCIMHLHLKSIPSRDIFGIRNTLELKGCFYKSNPKLQNISFLEWGEFTGGILKTLIHELQTAVNGTDQVLVILSSLKAKKTTGRKQKFSWNGEHQEARAPKICKQILHFRHLAFTGENPREVVHVFSKK